MRTMPQKELQNCISLQLPLLLLFFFCLLRPDSPGNAIEATFEAHSFAGCLVNLMRAHPHGFYHC